MASIIVAASKRAAYIRDKYHFGVECNTCDYNYTEPAILDFVSQCFDVCEATTSTPSGVQVTTCNTTVSQLAEPPCLAPTVTNCLSFVTIEVNNLELDGYITNSVNVFSEFITIYLNYIKVNGEFVFRETLDSANKFITITNLTIDENDFGQFRAHINRMNSVQNILQFSVGSTLNTMRIRYPAGSTFEIKTSHNDFFDENAHGVIITHNGLQGLQITTGGPYFDTAQFTTDSLEPWQRRYQVVNQETVC